MRLTAGVKCLSLVAFVAFVGIASTNCGGGTKAVKTDKLVVALEYTGAESNDGRDLQGTEGWQLRPQFETLIDVDRKTGAFVPMLATEWTVLPDGKSYDFKLRHGVQFQNGLGEMTAADVKFTYDHLAMRDTTPQQTANRRTQSVEIVNDYEVIIHERTVDPSNVDDQFSALYHNGFIMSKKDFDARGDPKSLNDLPLAGTGPYQMVSRTAGQSVMFKRVENQWRVKPDFAQLEYKIINEPSTRLAALLAGEVDITTVPIDQEKTATDRGMKRITGSVPSLRFFIDPHDCCTFDPKTGAYRHPDSPLMDIRVRQALNKAIDRNAINKAFLDGRGEVMILPHHHPTRPGWDPTWTKRFEKDYGYDPQAAMDLLKQAGYGPGHPLKTTMFAPVVTGVPSAEDITETIIDEWRKIGVQVDEQTVDRATFRPKAEAHEYSNIWWMYSTASSQLIGWNTYIYTGLPNSTGNFKTANTPEMDKVFEQMLGETDESKFNDLAKKLGELNYNNFSNIPLFWIPADVMVNPSVVKEWTWPGDVGGFYSHLEYVKARS